MRRCAAIAAEGLDHLAGPPGDASNELIKIKNKKYSVGSYPWPGETPTYRA